MALIGTVNSYGDRSSYTGINGVNDNDIVIETEDLSKFDTFHVSCNSGAADVQVHDGAQWLTAPHSLADLGAVAVDPVIVIAPLRDYGFRGFYFRVRVLQNGVTPCLGAVLRVSRTGG